MILPSTWALPESIRSRVGQNTYGRQRAIVEEGHLLLVLHRPPGPDDRHRDGVLFWRDAAGEWRFSHGGPGPAALKELVQSYASREEKLARDYARAVDTNGLFDTLEALTPLSRAAGNLRRALQQAREAFKRDAFLLELRDLAEDVERNLTLLLQDVQHAIQSRTAREAETQARLSREALQASHRLNVLAALFFPLTAISSLFGMNLAHGLNPNSLLIFWCVCLASVALGFGMKSWVLARPKEKETPKKK